MRTTKVNPENSFWWKTIVHLINEYAPNKYRIDYANRKMDFCSIVRAVFIGLLVAVLCAVILSIVALVALTPITDLLFFIFTGISFTGGDTTALGIVSIIGQFVYIIVVLALIFKGCEWCAVKFFKWIGRKLDSGVDKILESNRKKKRNWERKEPSPFVLWYKTFKEKTCFMIEFNPED